MQREIDAGKNDLKIQIVGVNEAGFDGSNGRMTSGRSLPWLQEEGDFSIWNSWQIEYRDVLILDDENHPVAVFNLTDYSLAVPANYDSLVSLLSNLSAIYGQ